MPCVYHGKIYIKCSASPGLFKASQTERWVYKFLMSTWNKGLYCLGQAALPSELPSVTMQTVSQSALKTLQWFNSANWIYNGKEKPLHCIIEYIWTPHNMQGISLTIQKSHDTHSDNCWALVQLAWKTLFQFIRGMWIEPERHQCSKFWWLVPREADQAPMA